MSEAILAKIRKAIYEAGADWIADETPLTRFFNRPTSFHGMGMAVTPEVAFAALSEGRSRELSSRKFSAARLPARIDWRNHNGANWVTPVRDQKSCGSCVAFATVAAIEARMQIKAANAALGIDLSEGQLFSCGAPNSCEAGWQPSLAMAYAKTHGIGLEKDFPYKPRNQLCKSIPIAVKVTKSSAASTSLARKTALVGGPVVAAMAVFSDFTSYKRGIYRHVIGQLTGYHAICIVGYDDAQGCWIAKNSWGTDWGEDGFFRIRYGECGIDTQYSFFVPEKLR